MDGTIYRVDKFVVPGAVRAEFLRYVRNTDAVLRRQRGFLEHTVLEQTAGPGAFNIVTIARWSDATAIENAKAAVTDAHRAAGFNPAEAMARLGIRADIGLYQPVAE